MAKKKFNPTAEVQHNGHGSGWTNAEIAAITGSHDLKCMECGDVFQRVRTNTFNVAAQQPTGRGVIRRLITSTRGR